MIIYKEEGFKIQGAIFNVYKNIGCGFLESVYQEALEMELEYQHIPFESQKEIKITYRDKELQHYFIADFVCYDKIIIEIKAVKALDDIHRAQLLNYLKATKIKLGILANFGAHPKVKIERIVL